MAVLSAQQIDLDGLEATYSAASGGGDEFAPDDRVFLHVKNGDASPTTVTITTPAKSGGLDVADQTATVPAGEERFVKPAQEHLIRAADGNADVSYSNVTSVTVALLRA